MASSYTSAPRRAVEVAFNPAMRAGRYDEALALAEAANDGAKIREVLSVQAEAARLNEGLLRDPSRLEALSQRYPPYRQHWLDGRGLPAVTVAVSEIAIGEVLRSPVAIGRTFVVGRRVPPRVIEAIAALTELPVPSGG